MELFTTANGWLITGFLLMLAELWVAGFACFFAGLGAVTTGILVYYGVGGIGPEHYLLHIACFLFASLFWTALLWKPLQRFRFSRNHSNYNNIVGETAYVGSNGLTKGSTGEVTWSGTIMKAEINAQSVADHIPAGAAVTITGMRGITLQVQPK